MSLRSRLLGFLLFGALLPVVLIAGFVFRYVETRLLGNLALRLAISAEEVRDRLDRELYDRYRDLKSLADDPALASGPAAALASFARTASKISPDLSRKHYLCLAVVRKDGTAIAESGPCETAGGRYRPYGPGPGDAYSAKTRELKDGTPVLDVYFPLAKPGNEAFGLKATEDLRPLSDMLARRTPPGGLAQDVVVYSAENQILARKNGGAGGSLAEAFPMLDKMDTQPAYAARGSVGRGRSAMAAVNTLAGAAPPLDELKWKVAVVQPLDDRSEQSLELLRQLRRMTAVVAVIAAAASTACWLFLLGRVKARDAAGSGAGAPS